MFEEFRLPVDEAGPLGTRTPGGELLGDDGEEVGVVLELLDAVPGRRYLLYFELGGEPLGTDRLGPWPGETGTGDPGPGTVDDNEV